MSPGESNLGFEGLGTRGAAGGFILRGGYPPYQPARPGTRPLSLTFLPLVQLKNVIKCIEEHFVTERLGQEGHRTRLQSPFTHPRLVVGSDEDDGKMVVTPDQEFLNL